MARSAKIFSIFPLKLTKSHVFWSIFENCQKKKKNHDKNLKIQTKSPKIPKIQTFYRPKCPKSLYYRPKSVKKDPVSTTAFTPTQWRPDAYFPLGHKMNS